MRVKNYANSSKQALRRNFVYVFWDFTHCNVWHNKNLYGTIYATVILLTYLARIELTVGLVCYARLKFCDFQPLSSMRFFIYAIMAQSANEPPSELSGIGGFYSR